MKRMIKILLTTMIVVFVGTTFAHAGSTDPLKGVVLSSISVKASDADRMTVHLQVQNATGADMQLWIRDDNGDVIHKERLQSGSFEKIFHLGMNEGERFRFDIRQGKSLVKSKEIRVVRKVEEVIEVQLFAAPNIAYRR